MLARSGRITILILLIILGRPGLARCQEQAASEPSFPRLLLIDVRDVVGAPLAWKSRQWELFGLSIAGIGVVALADGWVRDAEARDHNHLADEIARDVEPLGSTYERRTDMCRHPRMTLGTVNADPGELFSPRC